MIHVEYRHNNSGGSDWVSPEGWHALANAGWSLDTHHGRTYGASKDFPSLRAGIEEWTTLTGADPTDEGCNCCGQPHYFSGEDTTTGEWHYPKFEYTRPRLVWED